MKQLSILLITFLALNACNIEMRNNGQMTKPKESSVSISNLCLDQFNTEQIAALKRYLSGNPRWEVLYNKGNIYAIRKEMWNGKYQTTLNGYYSSDDSTGYSQTRVIISFRKPFGFGRDKSKITFTDSNDKDVVLTVKGDNMGSPGFTSRLIINGKNVNIEIFDQVKDIKRTFTQKTINELNVELLDVLKYEKEINENGVMPVADYYPYKVDSTYFNILDGSQPGKYIVQAGLKVDTEGVVYTKVFDTKTNERISAGRITPKTIREIGWSKNGQTIFPYESELTVYVGDWDHQYEARFELWFRGKNGVEKKLVEKSRLINGWQR